jgi:hypothetical protein
MNIYLCICIHACMHAHLVVYTTYIHFNTHNGAMFICDRMITILDLCMTEYA